MRVLLAIVVLAALGWSGFWYWNASARDRALTNWLEERRALNLKLGGNDDAFMTMLVYLTLINALPAAQEGRT